MSILKAIHIDDLYINLVYQKQEYVDIVGMAAEQSMRASVDDVTAVRHAVHLSQIQEVRT